MMMVMVMVRGIDGGMRVDESGERVCGVVREASIFCQGNTINNDKPTNMKTKDRSRRMRMR